MTDRELIDSAAKAAGLEYEWLDGWRGPVIGHGMASRSWLPLEDDGDAFRLAVKLRINIYNPPGRGASASGQIPGTYIVRYYNEKESDEAATRRAIVRAAADIGEQQ